MVFYNIKLLNKRICYDKFNLIIVKNIIKKILFLILFNIIICFNIIIIFR